MDMKIDSALSGFETELDVSPGPVRPCGGELLGSGAEIRPCRKCADHVLAIKQAQFEGVELEPRTLVWRHAPTRTRSR
jgi:hypothetical protein